MKKDERALRGFVQRYIQLPLPDHGGRLALLGAFAQVGGSAGCCLVACGLASPRCMPRTNMMCTEQLLSVQDTQPLFPALPAQQEGLEASSHVSLLAQLTEGLSAAQLVAFVQQLAARMGDSKAQRGTGGQCTGGGAAPAAQQQRQGQQAQQQQQPLAPLVQAALELLPAFPPVKPEEAQALREWTARAHSPLPPEVSVVLHVWSCKGKTMS